jgi:hypothetical protein
MLTSSRNRFSSLALILPALILLHSRELPAAMTSEEYVKRSITLLGILFPDVKDALVRITYSTNLEPNRLYGVDVSFQKPTLAPQVSPQPVPESLFASTFLFNVREQHLFYLSNGGPFISNRLDEFKKQVDVHPEWTDALVVSALKAAGARFGPDDRAAFLRTLPLRALEPLTGPLELISAEFVVRLDSLGDNDRPALSLMWHVDTRWHSRDGRYEANYFMTFEPFDGRCDHITFRWPRKIR